MSRNNQINERELRKLLNSEDTAEQALSTYFQIDDSNPFSPTYKVNPDIDVITDPEMKGFGLKETIIRIANSLARRKREKRYREIIVEHPDRIRLVSEGDSWFQHPLIKDTIDHLFNHFAVYSLGAGGDELSNMFNQNEYLPALQAEDAKCLLLSGGGNDLMGGHFGEYLNEYSPGTDPRRFLNSEFFAKVKDMMNIYQTIFDSMKQKRPNVIIFTHGYDYVIPRSGKQGKYLGKPMENKGITKPEDKKALARTIIDEFSNRMDKLIHQYDNAVFVDVRGTVRESHWHDEIHPDSSGFQQVSLKFINRINASLA